MKKVSHLSIDSSLSLSRPTELSITKVPTYKIKNYDFEGQSDAKKFYMSRGARYWDVQLQFKNELLKNYLKEEKRKKFL
jgi:hypothetical protein